MSQATLTLSASPRLGIAAVLDLLMTEVRRNGRMPSAISQQRCEICCSVVPGQRCGRVKPSLLGGTLGLDLGTQGVRAVLLDRPERRLGRGEASLRAPPGVRLCGTSRTLRLWSAAIHAIRRR